MGNTFLTADHATNPPVLSPDGDVINTFLEHAFGGDLDGLQNGLIEIAWCVGQGSGNDRWYSHQFGTDELDEATEFACEKNRAGSNIYFGPALRKPDHPIDQRGNLNAVMGTVLLWCDWDDDGAYEAATRLAKDAKPTAAIVTGRTPAVRGQAFWRLSEALTDADSINALVNGLAHKLKGDPKVVHADCLMRLPGTVSWRKVNKPDRIDEIVSLKIGNGLPAAYLPDELASHYPPIKRDIMPSDMSVPSLVERRETALGLGREITDGRETYMRDTVLACLREFAGENGAWPTAQELFEVAWPQYSAHVDFGRPGRGEAEMRRKCHYTAQRAEKGHIRGMETLEKAVESHLSKKGPDPARLPPEQALIPNTEDPGPIQASTLIGSAPPREWFIQDWMPKRAVTSLYGDGGVGKTLLAQQLATAHALGGTWCGIQVPKGRALCIMCEDDKDELWRRQDDIDAAYGVSMRSAQMPDLWLWPRVGFDSVMANYDRNDQRMLCEFYEKLMVQAERIQPTLLILDTASDIYSGNESNRNTVGQFVKSVIGSFVLRTKCTVLLLAHPSLSGMESGSGTSGSTGWNNSVRARWYLEKVKNGLPGQRLLTRKKSNYSTSGDDQNIPLIWEKGILTNQPAADTVDRIQLRSIKQKILNVVEAEWLAGRPLGGSNRASRHYRETLPRLIADEDPKLLVRAFVELERDGHVSTNHGDSHKRGYKVIDTGEVVIAHEQVQQND